MKRGRKRIFNCLLIEMPAYYTWAAMMRRCYVHNSANYRYYGGKGVNVCADWHTFKAFHDWAIANGWQKGLTIERVNNNGNYEPSNCKWITVSEQQKNKSKKQFRGVEYNGEIKCIAEWARTLSLSRYQVKKKFNLL